MTFLHKSLASGRWYKMSLVEQMGNVGSEVNRVLHWQEKKDKENMEKAAWRVLELIDLTISDIRWRHRLSEILRLREILCDKFFGENDYNISAQKIKDYFLPFALAARK